MSKANYQEPDGMRVELTPLPTQPYYLSSSAREPGTPFGSYRRYLFVSLGYQNPIATYRSPTLRNRNINPDSSYRVCRGDDCPFSIELSLPVSFQLFWDVFTNDAPITNTDYAFGGDLTGRISLIPDHEQRFRMYWGHISTHIGDEYLNGARNDPVHPFPRINPSYFPWRLGVSDRWFATPKRDWAYNSYLEVGAQAEGSCLAGCKSNGYYSVDPSQTDGVTIPLIPDGVEWSFTADWKRYTGLRTVIVNGRSREPHSMDLSAMWGTRTVFPYLISPPPERRWDPVFSATLGRTWTSFDPHNLGSIGLYARYFNGPNPYGQLRNQRHFHYWSIGLRFK